VVGGGLVGLATAMALGADAPAGGVPRVVVLEAEERVAAHQSGHNSGVIHSGLYYRPGSLKAALCVAGRAALYDFCAAEGIACQRIGKVVVAVTPEEVPALAELARRGRENGLAGVRLVDAAGLREIEPRAGGLAALWVPETGIVDYPAVARAYARRITAAGGTVATAARLLAARPVRPVRPGAGRARAAGGGGGDGGGGGLQLTTARGGLRCSLLVNCGGLQADRVARLCGLSPATRIAPFRGEYWELSPAARDGVRGLIYPVPDPRFPFLGFHLTRTVGGEVEAGPNALLAWRREGYRRGSFSPRDTLDLLTFPGFWRFAARHWRTGLGEIRRSASPALVLRDLRRLLPALAAADLHRAGSGVRAMELDRQGRMIDDFHVVAHGAAVHVLNAPSPAATASIAIGRHIAGVARAALAAQAAR
jgi:L-2-hydroxyglutarate oxidase